MLKYIKKASQEHVILFSLGITIITLIISSLFHWDNNPITGLDKLSGDILITVFCLMIIYGLGIQQTSGLAKKGFGKGLVYGIPFIIIGILAAVIGNMGINFSQLQPISLAGMTLFTVNMIFVGVNEELSMRSLILNNLIHKYGESRKSIYKAILISSIIFGAIHLVNIFFMSPVTVLVQTINAASAGVLFAAIYICSKNIWAGIVIHALVDWLALFIGQCFVGGESVLSVSMTIPQGIMMIILGSLPPLVIAIIMINKKIAKE
ncbi:MAG: lysostaphin resistance A-like protein [Cellulosilyticaceae bacterium]